MFPLQPSTGHGKPVGRSPFCLHHSCTTLSSCENRWKKFLGLAKSLKVIDDTSSFLSLKFPPLLRPSRSEVFDEADIKGIFTYLLFKTAHDTNFYFYGPIVFWKIMKKIMRKRPFRFDNFAEYTRQKIMHSSSKNTKYTNSGMRSYLIISSYIFPFTIYINFISGVLRCHTAIQIFTSLGKRVPRIQRVVPLRLKQSVRYIM